MALNRDDADREYERSEQGPWKPSFGDVESAPIVVTKAVREALAGKVVTLAIADHPMHGVKVYEVLSFGLGDVDGVPTLRWCGPDGTPDGDGSHSVVASWYEDRLDPGLLASTVMYHVVKRIEAHVAQRTPWVYLKEVRDASHVQAAG